MDEQTVERRTMRAVSWRLLPFLFILYVFSYLDRSNVSIAALQMNDELRFSPAVFGLGAGIFFLGYALFEIPSNIVLVHVGARRWIARIMITWGFLASAMMWVHTPVQFYILRFLLGVAEAGFFPGVIYYLTQWFPQDYRARATARFSVAIPISQVVGGALGGPLLGLSGTANLSGWQWVFLLEGLPSLILGIVVLFYLTDRPQVAEWLTPTEREWLVNRIEQDKSKISSRQVNRPLADLSSPFVWLLALPYFAYYTVAFAYTSWAPLLVRSALGTRDATTGLISAGIALVSAAAYLLSAMQSDRNHDRCGYAGVGLAMSVAGCIGAAIAPTPLLKVMALALIPIGGGMFLPSFWCLPSLKFNGASAATVIALISAVGSSGGFFGPNIIGYARRATGGDTGAFLVLAGIGLVGCFVCIGLRRSGAFKREPVATVMAQHS
jgi:MFS transporter, ACS family, tartrate transporter